MSRLLAMVQLDVRLQARNQLYVIGAGVAVLLGVMVRTLIPVEYAGRGLAAFYLMGLGGTTFMFGASMLLLEKGERTLEALRVSHVTTFDYVASKALTLTAFALVESAIVYVIAARGVATDFGLLIGGTVLLGVFYTLVGVGLASAYDVVTRFLLPTGTFVGMLFQLPFLSLIGVGPWWLWYLIPTQAPLLVLQGAFEPLARWQWAYAATVSVVMLLGAIVFCRQRFRTHIRFPEG